MLWHTHTHIMHTYTHIHTDIHTHKHILIDRHIHICACVYTYTHIHTLLPKFLGEGTKSNSPDLEIQTNVALHPVETDRKSPTTPNSFFTRLWKYVDFVIQACHAKSLVIIICPYKKDSVSLCPSVSAVRDRHTLGYDIINLDPVCLSFSI